MSSASELPLLDTLIRKLEGIATLSADERQAIDSLRVNARVLGPGQDIVRDGDKPSRCCLLLRGWVCRYKLLNEGRRQILSLHIPGDISDLQSLFIPTMDHSLATLSVSEVAFISHEDLRDLIHRFPRIGATLWHDMMVDTAVLRETLVGMGRRSAIERIAHLFCELYLKLQAVGLAENYCYSFPIKQADLGDALGLSYVHVNRVLQELRSKRVVTLRHRTLVVEDWNELSRIAEFDATYLHLEKRADG